MSTKTGGKLFYGWIIVFAGILVTGATIGVFNNTLSVFVKPVTEDLGFNRGQFTLYNSIMGISGMIIMPFYGELFRAGKMKLVMPICSCLLALAAVGYSFSSQLWQFYLFAVLGGLSLNGTSTIAISTIVNNWFYEKKGLATGIALSGTGLFASIMVPIVTRVIEGYSWRWGYRLLALVGISVLLPTIFFLIKVKPSDMGLEPYGAKPEVAGETRQEDAVGFTRQEALKMPSFYLMMFGIVLSVTAGVSMQGHGMSYLTDIGYSSALASTIVSVSMLALVAGKIILGGVFDRFGILTGCVSVCVSFIVGPIMLLLSANGNPVTPFLYALCLGYGLSIGSVASSLVTSRYFGTRDFSRIFSILGVAGSLGSALGQPVGGFIFDITGSYVPAWIVAMGISVVTIGMFALANTSNKRAWDRLIERESAAQNSVAAPVDNIALAAGEEA